MFGLKKINLNFKLKIIYILLAKSCSISMAYNTVVEDLPSLLFRHQLLKIIQTDQGKGIKHKLNNDHAKFLFEPNKGKLAKIEEMIHEVTKDEKCVNPFDIKVEYEDSNYGKIKKVFLSKSSDYTHDENSGLCDVKGFEDLVKKSIPVIETYSHKVKNSFQELTFDQVQTEESFIKGKSLGGQTVRIAGVQKETFPLLKELLKKYAAEFDLEVVNIFLFGSRVMPRSVLVQYQPELLGDISVEENGIKKNSIRVNGLTNFSDLEVAIFVKRKKEELLPFDSISTKMKGQIFNHFATFPIGIKILEVDQDVPADEHNYYYLLLKNYMLQSGRHDCRSQYVPELQLYF